MNNPTYTKDHSIIPKLFSNNIRFVPTSDPNAYAIEDTKLKRICEFMGVDYIDTE